MTDSPPTGAQLPVVACTLGDDDMPGRRREWETLCAEALLAIREMASGLVLEFRPGGEIEAELGRLADLEAECCAFAQWTVRPGPGATVLEVTAEPDAVPAVHALFARR